VTDAPTPFSLRYRQVHLDFHTSPAIDGIGADFDPEAFAETLARAHVDSVTVFARCHHGHLYYDSKRFPERIHPHLANRNLLAEQIAACHKRGIRAPIYVTVQWDQYTADRHREWLLIDEEGKEYGTSPLKPGFYRNLDVFHPGYRQFLFDHVGEILDTLPVDGLFFDIVQPRPSLALHWIEAMDAAGLDPADKADRYRFAVQVIHDWEREMSAFVRERVPDATLFYNSGHVGPRHRPNADAYSHFELESLPSGGWGYLHFPQAMRYARTLGPDCLGMTGKFHTSWGDFGSYKNPAALEFECFQMLALGAKCSVGDQLPPRGRLDAKTYELIGGVYASVEAKEPYCRGAVPVVEAAVLTPEAFIRGRADYALELERRNPSVLGAVRLLHELRVQYDIVDDAADFSRYQVLILPDEIPVDDALSAKIEAFVAAGGALIASARSGLAPGEEPRFNLPSLGVAAVGPIPAAPDYLVPGAALGSRLPEGVPHVMYGRGYQVAVEAPDAEILATVQAPYFERGWRHFCSHAHTPSSGQDAGYPGMVQRGRCVYLAHPVFRQYQENAPRWCREVVGAALDRLLPAPLVKAPGAPTGLLTALNWQETPGRYVLHLLYYVPERRGQAFDVIEDVVPLYDVKVSIAVPETITAVMLAPEGEGLEYSLEQNTGRVVVTVPRLHGHAIVTLVTA
jgi:Beta-galactosidase